MTNAVHCFLDWWWHVQKIPSGLLRFKAFMPRSSMGWIHHYWGCRTPMFLNRKLLSYTKQKEWERKIESSAENWSTVSKPGFFGGKRMGGRKRIDDVGWSGKREPLTEKDVVRNPVYEWIFSLLPKLVWMEERPTPKFWKLKPKSLFGFTMVFGLWCDCLQQQGPRPADCLCG